MANSCRYECTDCGMLERYPRNNCPKCGNDNYRVTVAQKKVSVVFNPPHTIVHWKDGSKTVVKISGDDEFREDYGFAMALAKKHLGRSEFLRIIENANRQDGMSLKEYEKKMDKRRKKQAKLAKKNKK